MAELMEEPLVSITRRPLLMNTAIKCAYVRLEIVVDMLNPILINHGLC
jgi:hypothetical protein